MKGSFKNSIANAFPERICKQKKSAMAFFTDLKVRNCCKSESPNNRNPLQILHLQGTDFLFCTRKVCANLFWGIWRELEF